MPNDVIRVNYEQLGEVAQRWESCADAGEAILSGLSHTMDDLRDSWEGEASVRFFGEMEGQVLPRLRKLNHALAESRQTTLEIVRIFQDAEDEASQVVNGAGGVGEGTAGAGILGGISTSMFSWTNKIGSNIFDNEPDTFAFMKPGDVPMHRWGRYKEWGDVSRPELSDYVDAKIKLLSLTETSEFALLESRYSSDLGTMTLSTLGVRGHDTLEASITPEGLTFEQESYRQAYLAKFAAEGEVRGVAYNGEVVWQSVEAHASNKFSASLDGIEATQSYGAGYHAFKGALTLESGPLEANLQADAGASFAVENKVVINETNAYVSSKGDAFAGVRGQADVSFDLWGFGKITLTGEGNLGAGAGYNADAGIKDGKAVADLGAYAGLGVGGGGRVQVELDVPKIVNSGMEWWSKNSDTVVNAFKDMSKMVSPF